MSTKNDPARSLKTAPRRVPISCRPADPADLVVAALVRDTSARNNKYKQANLNRICIQFEKLVEQLARANSWLKMIQKR